MLPRRPRPVNRWGPWGTRRRMDAPMRSPPLPGSSPTCYHPWAPPSGATSREREAHAVHAGNRRRRDLHGFRRLRPRHQQDRGLEGPVDAGRSGRRHPRGACRASTIAARSATSAARHHGRDQRHPRAQGRRCRLRHDPGFHDVPFIQRGNRKSHYDINWVKPEPLVKRRHCFELDERIDADGQVVDAARRGRAARAGPPADGADARDRGGRRLPAVLLPQPDARAARRRRSSPRSRRTCRSRSPTTCCRSGRNTSAPRRPSPTPISSRWSAGQLGDDAAPAATRPASTRNVAVIKSNGGEMTLEAAARCADPYLRVRPDRRRDRRRHVAELPASTIW